MQLGQIRPIKLTATRPALGKASLLQLNVTRALPCHSRHCAEQKNPSTSTTPDLLLHVNLPRPSEGQRKKGGGGSRRSSASHGQRDECAIRITAIQIYTP